MDRNRIDGWLLAVTRILAAAVFWLHGVPKALDPTMAMAKFTGFGLPGILGPAVGWIEVVGGGLLVLGLWFRPAVMTLLVIIVGALVTVQIPAGVRADLERDLLLVVTLGLLAWYGPGHLALTRRWERG